MPIRQGIWRDMECSKEDFMFYLFNHYGDDKLAFAYNYEHEGEIKFSKWIDYKVLMSVPDGCMVNGLKDSLSREEFVKRVSHRTILDIELLFDIDDKLLNGHEFDSIKDKSIWVVSELRRLGHYPVVYFTGNKSYHISLIIPKWRQFDERKRRTMKEIILKEFGADTQKAGRALIAIENGIHYKSGKEKVEVEL